MKTLAKHLVADLYGCHPASTADKDAAEGEIADKLQEAGYTILKISSEHMTENHAILTAVFNQGHITVHVYADLKYVATDIFLNGNNAEPEILFKEIRNFFKPEKTRITVLKRGDFKQGSDMKPQIKTRVAPLRKIHNTGAKVIRTLARRK